MLSGLVQQPVGVKATVPEHLETEIAKTGRSTIGLMDGIGRRSFVTCPECAGALWEMEEGDTLRYRCHIGHAFSADLVDIALEESFSRGPGGCS